MGAVRRERILAMVDTYYVSAWFISKIDSMLPSSWY